MFLSEGREVLEHMLEINEAVKYFQSDSAENKIKCSLSCHAASFKVSNNYFNYFESSFAKGPRIVSPPFPHAPSAKDCWEGTSIQNLHEDKHHT